MNNDRQVKTSALQRLSLVIPIGYILAFVVLYIAIEGGMVPFRVGEMLMPIILLFAFGVVIFEVYAIVKLSGLKRAAAIIGLMLVLPILFWAFLLLSL